MKAKIHPHFSETFRLAKHFQKGHLYKVFTLDNQVFNDVYVNRTRAVLNFRHTSLSRSKFKKAQHLGAV